MLKKFWAVLSLMLIASMVLAACGATPTATPTQEATQQPTQEPTPTLKVGMVTDMGGIDDKSFNATAWKGVEMAIKDLGIDGSYLESQQQTDYATNITQYINQGANLIVTVGFLLADDTAKFAAENPDVNFAIVDNSSLGPNVRGLTFATDQAGFLAGYVAAAATKTGKVATFGGINIPTVTIFMVGFEAGVKYYNQQKGTNVQVLGWDTAKNNGVFAGNFESTDDGRRIAEEFMSEGADIVMPVAGPVGLGSAQAVQEHGNAWVIGVDTDWTISAAQYKDVVLTSVMKKMDVAVYDTIKMVMDPNFKGFNGENYVGTLANNGVDIAPVAAGAVPADVLKEIETIKQGIIDGKIDTGWDAYLKALESPEPTPTLKVGMVTDMGGIDDKSFNATAWKGVEMAIKDLGIDGSYLESQQQTDYATNITQYINQGANLIVTVGFLLADDTAKFAAENPDVNFAIVDNSSLGPNVRGLTFATDQAGFLAGYVAAAATKTGKVATFGGINIPTVTIFMVGFEAGVKYYNQQKGTNVQVLGWDTAKNNGVFAGNFESTDDGRRIAEEFMSEGADIVMPVAGPVGLGSAQAVQEHGNAWVIGVDTDWTISAAQYKDVVLTSVMKKMDVAVYDTIKMVMDPNFKGFNGENYVGTLANNGVDIAPVAAGAVPADVLKEIETIKQGIIDGKIDTGWDAYLASLQ
ncbi:MAG TPA: BMP family ABC transporter substrate-binding protein [Anaerolineae bacterium]|nr:BMP family ABC transporter substrate-binding protein [Anaerolineae bacterium]